MLPEWVPWEAMWAEAMLRVLLFPTAGGSLRPSVPSMPDDAAGAGGGTGFSILGHGPTTWAGRWSTTRQAGRGARQAGKKFFFLSC